VSSQAEHQVPPKVHLWPCENRTLGQRRGGTAPTAADVARATRRGVLRLARLSLVASVRPSIYGDRMTQVHRTIDPDGVPVAVGGYSHVAVVPAGAELLFVAGQVPEDLDGTVPDGFADQARLAWRNVERCLAAGGFTLDHLVKVSMYIRDRSYRVANREVRHEVLGDRRPVLTVLVTDHWDERWLIEIEAMAARPVT
jgi:2-iminobutanoate/2-iminopropanoate deaminase